jgi:hypothetical protein
MQVSRLGYIALGWYRLGHACLLVVVYYPARHAARWAASAWCYRLFGWVCCGVPMWVLLGGSGHLVVVLSNLCLCGFWVLVQVLHGTLAQVLHVT